jgi:MoaA/NifB/PqqE/SkfB family radical SAM enzyme
MTPEEVDGLIREAADWGVPRVALTGAGEPFRDPCMLEHLRLADRLGLLATVTSNGFPVTEPLAAALAGMRVSVSISIHAAREETEDRITGVRGSGARAWTAIRRLVAARDAAGARGRFFVSVSTVLQRDNVAEALPLVRRSRQEGCDGHNLQPVNLQHGSFRAGTVIRRDDVALMARLWPTAEQSAELDRLFDALVEFRRAHGHLRTPEDRLRLFRRYFADPARESLQVSCRVGEWFLGVDHRGRVKPCYRLPWDLGDARLGRVRRLWNSQAYADVRRTVDACPLTCMNNCFFRT